APVPKPAGVEKAAGSRVVSGSIRVPEVQRDTGSQRDTGLHMVVSPLIVRILRDYIPDLEDASVVSLVEACRKIADDASEEEIAHFVRLKADLMSRMGTIKSPMGFLKTAVPRCFEGESFRQFRQAEAQRRATASPEIEDRHEEVRRFRQQQEAILNNPSASPE